MDRHELNQQLPRVVDDLVKSIVAQPKLKHLNRVFLPNREQIIEIITRLREITYPGYFGRHGLTTENLPHRIGQNVFELTDLLFEQVRCCLRYRQEIPEPETPGPNPQGDNCDREAARIVGEFWKRLPDVREWLTLDAEAAFQSDPAAHNIDETVFCYPGLFAITVQRMAHEFYKLDVPLLPRIMCEHAHGLTGIDIHPGARLGHSFFVDHGTGVVIGETTEIGDNVKIYQGVTLGALAPAYGQYLRGQKRHPTIQDNVTIYSHATILGGETVIGEGCVIGGNVFITSSVPPHNQVSAEPPKLKYRDKRPKRREGEIILDFQI